MELLPSSLCVGNFQDFFGGLLTFQKLTFSKNSFKNAISVKWFGSRSGLHSV